MIIIAGKPAIPVYFDLGQQGLILEITARHGGAGRLRLLREAENIELDREQVKEICAALGAIAKLEEETP